MGISGHYSEAWAIAPQLRVEVCGSWWKPVEVIKVVRKRWKTCGRHGHQEKAFGLKAPQKIQRKPDLFQVL